MRSGQILHTFQIPSLRVTTLIPIWLTELLVALPEGQKSSLGCFFTVVVHPGSRCSHSEELVSDLIGGFIALSAGMVANAVYHQLFVMQDTRRFC